MVLDSNFKEFIELLNANGVKYLVVGGFAVAFHGYPRYTKDIDFWIWADPENAERIIKAIEEFGLGSLGLQASDFLNPENIIQLGYEPNRIDLITQLEGIDFEECYEQRRQVEFEGVPLNFIDLDSLIRSKRVAGRFKDLADVEKLEKQKKKKKS
ncbi:MAG: nucleotidyltransferase [Lewinellaceae bacterium]|nr:nucleotidyltransferase [Saprospiraceae bacterium]MCB9338942.1 nucleotidyltransferase [Lewinellaceae bacterium]